MITMPLEVEVPVQKFTEYLHEKKTIYVNPNTLRQESERLRTLADIRYKELLAVIYATTGTNYGVVRKVDIIDYLMKMGVPGKLFCKRGSNSPTLYNQDVRDAIIAQGHYQDAMTMYQDLNKSMYYAKQAESLLQRHNLAQVKSNKGEDLLEIRYNVEASKNLRFNTNNENVIGFSGQTREAITAPEGYYILSCDFPQIDARSALNIYLKNSEVVEMTEHIDDTYLMFKEYARRVDQYLAQAELKRFLNLGYYVETNALEEKVANYNSEILPFEGKDERDVYKVIALKTMYGGSTTPFQEIRKAISMLSKMYKSTERYSRLGYVAKLLYDNDIPIKTSSRWGGSKRPIHAQNFQKTMFQVYNAPIQTTSSEVIIFYTTAFLNYFRERGIGVDGVYLAMNRHDEPVFCIKKEVFHEHLGFIASMRVVLVEGWQPFRLEMYVGETYKQNEETAKEALDRIPDDYDVAMHDAKRFANLQEPLVLAEPKLVYCKTHVIDGILYLALVHYVGEFSDEIILDKEYRDRRDIKITVMHQPLTEQDNLRDLTLKLINDFIGVDNDPKYDEYLLNFDSSKVHTEMEFHGKLVYLRNNGGHFEKGLCKSVLGNILKQKGYQIPLDYINYMSDLEENKHRFVK